MRWGTTADRPVYLALAAALALAPLGAAAGETDDAAAKIDAAVKAHCAKEWPTKLRMQVWCIDQQYEGLKEREDLLEYYRHRATKQRGWAVVFPAFYQCQQEWPGDFKMQAWCLRRELEAAVKLGLLPP